MNDQKNHDRRTAEQIRLRYAEKTTTDADALRALDRRVHRPALLFAYIFGALSSLVMGFGMCLAMEVIAPGTYLGITVPESTLLPGILIGLVGIALCVLTYPLYRGILAARRRKFAPQIEALCSRVLG